MTSLAALGLARGVARKIANLCSALAHLPLWWLSRCWPKDPDLWVFGAWGGLAYSDNSRAFFEWVRAHRGDVRAVWLGGRAVTAELRALGLPCCRAYGLGGYLLCLRAGVAVISNARTLDLNRFVLAGRTRVVQLWHGTPIKKIGFDDRVHSHNANTWTKRVQRACHRLSARLFPAQRESCDLLTVSAARTIPHYASAFRIAPSKIAVTGLARNDRLLAQRRPRDARARKRVIYLPTFRGRHGSRYNPLAHIDLEATAATLEAIDAELVLKLHPANELDAAARARLTRAERITLLGNADVHDALVEADALVTDYSSVFIDFLLLDRPIVFFAYDLDDYLVHGRELYYDYDDITPGPKARTWAEVLAALRALDRPRDAWAAERARVRRRFHDYEDARSCERIFAAIRRLQRGEPIGQPLAPSSVPSSMPSSVQPSAPCEAPVEVPAR